jgi:hypothetical protein
VSDTALNLLAIAIFAITMSSLLAPLTGLSPLVPSAIAVLLLGFYGLDTAYGEGRRGSSILEWFEERLPGYQERQERILHHEAGHFLAAHVLGIKILNYNLKSKAGVEVDVSLDRELTLNGLERYCTVWMAGIAAEQHIYQTALGGKDDIRKLKNATKDLPDSQLQQRWAMLRAQNLVNEYQTVFGLLVAEMRQGANVETCCQIIDKSKP